MNTIVKLTIILLLAAGTTVHCLNLFLKEDAEIARVKNNSKMEDFYSHPCKMKSAYLRRFTRSLLDKAIEQKNYDAASAKLVAAFEGVDDIAATKIRQVWRSDVDKKRKVWITECETEKPKKIFYLHFIEKDRRLVLDVVN